MVMDIRMDMAMGIMRMTKNNNINFNNKVV